MSFLLSESGAIGQMVIDVLLSNMINGIYKVEFTGPEEGSGVVIVRDFKFTGGDGYFYYSGVFSQHVGELEATFEVKRHTPGAGSVFGRDALTATLTGKAGHKGFFLEAPGKAFTISGEWLEPAIFENDEKAASIASREAA